MAAEVKDYYKTLGVNKDASQDEIKKAFQKACAQISSRPESGRQDCRAEVQRA